MSADTRGTRTRAGNNMSRSRAGILAGAGQCILQFGTRKSTMGDIARVGGVAKATVYNHFRDKRELYAALVEAEVDALIERFAAAYAASDEDPLVAGLSAAAIGVTDHSVLRYVADNEPVVLGTMTRLGAGAGWLRARSYAAGLLGAAQPSNAGDLAVRWVISHAAWPASHEHITSSAVAVAFAVRALAEGDLSAHPSDTGDDTVAGLPVGDES